MKMKILLAAAIAVSMLNAAAGAEDKPKPVAVIKGPTILECLGVLAGLNALDGRRVLVGKGKSTETAEQLPYKLSGKTRDSISHNIFVLNQVQAEAQAANRRAQLEIGNGEPIKPGSREALLFDQRMADYTARPCGVELDRIKDSELFIDENEFPPSVLSALWPIRER